MKSDFKDIHIGKCIKKMVEERGISTDRICNYFEDSENEIELMYDQKSLNTEIVLKWSKLLKYDFFRIYSQHLILFSPPGNHISKPRKIAPLQFRKNVYTMEIIDFVLEMLNTGEKTKQQVISEYKIPKTTLYKWISKYDQKNRNE
ncbi:hypothetical protein HNP38_001860 [Chryseobacterium defluvii]|uniref:Uncharacterized protein n=1 Tax=Chryseobacterium defluvii TaxID=160396 RepID=A0A840KFS2_9FLAO|nr:transposase [Chryseobacterium defluvii]MBB4806564.1 hypothetical protein [Chryseobacterium defluvii]